MYKLQINSLRVHIIGSQKILSDISELKDDMSKFLGMNVKVQNNEICRVFFGNRYMTDKEYIETNFPRNKKITIEYIGKTGKLIVAVKVYSHGHIKCIASGEILSPHARISTKNYGKKLISFPRNFKKAYFLGEEIKDFSPIRKFYEGKKYNEREKLFLWEEFGVLNISLLYGALFDTVIFCDEEDKSEDFNVKMRIVQYYGNGEAKCKCARFGKIQQEEYYGHYKSIIFRGNKCIEVVSLKYYTVKFPHDPKLDSLLEVLN